MTVFKTLIFTLLAITVSACSKPREEKDREMIHQTKGEWTHEQTNKAIDIYLNVLQKEEELVDRELQLQRNLQFFDENRCARDVLRTRRPELDSLRRIIQSKRDTLASLTR